MFRSASDRKFYQNGGHEDTDFHHKAGSTRSYSSYSQRKMTNTVRASNKAAILVVGEELRQLLHMEDPPLIKDRRYHLRVYQDCFVGYEMVDWLLKKGEVESEQEAVSMMQKLLENGVIHHVCDDHSFKNEKLFYRFRKDDGTYEEPPDTAILAKGQRIYSRIKGENPDLLMDRKYHLTTYKQCFVGKEFVDWLVSKGEASNREAAMELGTQLLDAGVFKHVCDDHHFKDEYLFYRFKNDDKTKTNKPSKKADQKKENRSSFSSTASTDTRSMTPEVEEYVHMESPEPSRFKIPPPLATTEIKTNGSYPNTTSTLTGAHRHNRATVDELLDPKGPYVKRSVNVESDPVGYGFVIRGSKPVYIHSIDPNGPAAASGLQVGEYLYSVNGQDVLMASHTDAARIILMGSSTASLVTFVARDRLPSSCPIIP